MALDISQRARKSSQIDSLAKATRDAALIQLAKEIQDYVAQHGGIGNADNIRLRSNGLRDDKPEPDRHTHNLVKRILEQEAIFNFARGHPQDDHTRRCRSLLRLLHEQMCTTPSIQALHRDAIANPANYSITWPWFHDLLISFFLLVTMTFFINSSLFVEITQPYKDATGGCFFESWTPFASQSLNPVDKPNNTCSGNNETFGNYAPRWVDFIIQREQFPGCQGTVLAVGGGVREKQLDEGRFLLFPDLTICSPSPTSASSSTTTFPTTTTTTTSTTIATVPPLSSIASTPPTKQVDCRQQLLADFRSKFINITCPNPDVCQRLVLLAKHSAHKIWNSDTKFRVSANYNVFVEVEWRLIESGCRTDLRVFAVPTSSDVGYPAGAIGFGVAVIACLVIPAIVACTTREPKDDDANAVRLRARFPWLWSISLLAVGFCTVSFVVVAWWISSSTAIFVLLYVLLSVQLAFLLLHVVRWVRVWWLRYSAVDEDSALISIERWNAWYQQIVGFDLPQTLFFNYCGGRKLALRLACWFAVTVFAATFQDLSLNSSHELQQFNNVWSLRIWFKIVALAYSPIGLEFVMYIPNFFCWSIKSPSIYVLVLVFTILFILLPRGDQSYSSAGGELIEFFNDLVHQMLQLAQGVVTEWMAIAVMAIAGVVIVVLILVAGYDVAKEHALKSEKLQLILGMKQSGKNTTIWLHIQQTVRSQLAIVFNRTRGTPPANNYNNINNNRNDDGDSSTRRMTSNDNDNSDSSQEMDLRRDGSEPIAQTSDDGSHSSMAIDDANGSGEMTSPASSYAGRFNDL